MMNRLTGRTGTIMKTYCIVLCLTMKLAHSVTAASSTTNLPALCTDRKCPKNAGKIVGTFLQMFIAQQKFGSKRDIVAFAQMPSSPNRRSVITAFLSARHPNRARLVKRAGPFMRLGRIPLRRLLMLRNRLGLRRPKSHKKQNNKSPQKFSNFLRIGKK